MSGHALLSASGAHRWLACPGSVQLEKGFGDTSSVYAQEGTLAHELCELTVSCFILNAPHIQYETQLRALKQHSLWSEEMLSCAEAYLDYIRSVYLKYPTMPILNLERRVNFSEYVPGGFGTADCIVMWGDELHIIDYKHGKGVEVSAERNPQMMLYALGALNEYGFLYNIKRVFMTIVQPRINNISEWELSAHELQEWGAKVVKPTAEKAYKGCEEYTPGEHCRFCKAKALCKARAEKVMELKPVADKWKADGSNAMKPLNPTGLYTAEELGAYLKAGELIKAWYEDISAHALTLCLAGQNVPGYKAVEGRSARDWTDQENAFKALLEAGTDKALLYNYVPLTLAQAEKVVGKKRFNEVVGQYIIKKPGKPTLAPATDKREAITNNVTAENVFKKMED